MHWIFKTFIFCLCGFFSSYVLAGDDCEDMLKKFEKCRTSTAFIEFYTQACYKGGELSAPDLSSIERFLESEVDNNRCLQKIYKPPKYERKVRIKWRREIRAEQKRVREEKKKAREAEKRKAAEAARKDVEE